MQTTYTGTIKLTPKYAKCDPIYIKGTWTLDEEKNRWTSPNTIPYYYSNVALNADLCELIDE